MKRPPCIRNLREFKKGCPQRAWNGEDGCPAWMEMEIPNREGGKTPIKECLDLYRARLQWHTNALLTGTQGAIESFRNNMTFTDESGNCHPKPDPAMVSFLSSLSQHKRIE